MYLARRRGISRLYHFFTIVTFIPLSPDLSTHHYFLRPTDGSSIRETLKRTSVWRN